MKGFYVKPTQQWRWQHVQPLCVHTIQNTRATIIAKASSRQWHMNVTLNELLIDMFLLKFARKIVISKLITREWLYIHPLIPELCNVVYKLTWCRTKFTFEFPSGKLDCLYMSSRDFILNFILWILFDWSDAHLTSIICKHSLVYPTMLVYLIHSIKVRGRHSETP